MENRVAVAMAVQDAVCAPTCFDLANLVSRHICATDDTIISLYSEGSILASQRHQLVVEARRENATHVLFVDSDMRFPEDALMRLLAAEVRVIGANCPKRKMPTGPTAANYDSRGRKIPVYTNADTHGIEQVARVGTGFLLVEMDVFDIVPAPWFETPWIPERLAFMGEDVAFCVKLAQKKIPVFIDHDLSREIAHIGAFEFRHEHVEAVREIEAVRNEPLIELVSA